MKKSNGDVREERVKAIVKTALGARAERAADWVVGALDRLASKLVDAEDKAESLRGTSGKSDTRVLVDYDTVKEGVTEEWLDLPPGKEIVFVLKDGQLRMSRTHENAVRVRSYCLGGPDTVVFRSTSGNQGYVFLGPWAESDPQMGKELKRS